MKKQEMIKEIKKCQQESLSNPIVTISHENGVETIKVMSMDGHPVDPEKVNKAIEIIRKSK